MNEHFNYDNLVKKLYLRPPQKESLDLLDRIMQNVSPSKDADLSELLERARVEFSAEQMFQDFDRGFPSYCFAIATGVGKTRLMGAFISYLFLKYGLENFLVLAPNLTIYKKLIADFTPNTQKYVFSGIEEFVLDQPKVITGDSYENGQGVREKIAPYLPVSEGDASFGEGPVFVNIFNISKITAKDKGHYAADDARKNIPRFRRNNEYIGEGGYFQYLTGLRDLVVIMDESHQYRADAGMEAINDLRPILGLELTATPQVQHGSKKPIPFNNIIYNYPLSKAISDGYVKMPAVATRENFDADAYSPEQLEQLKLQDGIHIHEETKAELLTYARNTENEAIKPFILVIARDTTHAEELKQKIESPDFFDGKYIGKVITVHSNTTGSEKDEVIEQLLTVEKADNPIEIVIHVNMLKEGWDVTNLYTIIPLRAADSQTLVEQSIGRGLRLPYGKRTGVDAVDRLTIVAHEHFNEIVQKAQEGSLHYDIEKLVIKADEPGKVSVPQYSVFDDTTIGLSTSEDQIVRDITEAALRNQHDTIRPAIVSKVKEAILKNSRMRPEESLRSPEYRDRIFYSVKQAVSDENTEPEPHDEQKLNEELTSIWSSLTHRLIVIPNVVILPREKDLFGYKPLKLDTSRLHFKQFQSDILIENMDRTGERRTLNRGTGTIHDENAPEDYILRELYSYNDIDYDGSVELLEDLCRQAIVWFKTYLKDNDTLIDVLIHYQKEIAAEIHDQMQRTIQEHDTEYDVQVSCNQLSIKSGRNFSVTRGEPIRDYRDELSPGERNKIKTILFGGYQKSIFFPEKFDSYSELEFVRYLENNLQVEKWLRPTTKQIRIAWRENSYYEPDFIVETQDEMLMVEIKRHSELDDPEVLTKAKAATLWCKHATAFAEEHGGKPWKYVLIPHDAIAPNMSLAGLVKRFEENV